MDKVSRPNDDCRECCDSRCANEHFAVLWQEAKDAKPNPEDEQAEGGKRERLRGRRSTAKAERRRGFGSKLTSSATSWPRIEDMR